MTVTLTQFTDPLCTWCWGAEPVRRRVEETYGDQVRAEYVMGGLVADFAEFRDDANGIDDPADVAPHWEAAAERHGMPVDPGVWRTDPPRSSYPASEAFHAARFQGTDAASRYLRRVREAVATGGRNVADRSVLVDLASAVGLDIPAFEAALNGGRARAAFAEDRSSTRRKGVSAFPTFHVAGPDGDRWLRGNQPYEALAEAVEAVAPGVERRAPRPLAEFLAAHERVATREVAEVYGLDRSAAVERLEAIEARGGLRRRSRGTGYLWETTGDGRPSPPERAAANGGGAR